MKKNLNVTYSLRFNTSVSILSSYLQFIDDWLKRDRFMFIGWSGLLYLPTIRFEYWFMVYRNILCYWFVRLLWFYFTIGNSNYLYLRSYNVIYSIPLVIMYQYSFSILLVNLVGILHQAME